MLRYLADHSTGLKVSSLISVSFLSSDSCEDGATSSICCVLSQSGTPISNSGTCAQPQDLFRLLHVKQLDNKLLPILLHYYQHEDDRTSRLFLILFAIFHCHRDVSVQFILLPQ